jgi:hypothetical protein
LPASIFSSLPGRPFVDAFWTGITARLLAPVGLALTPAVIEGPVVMVAFLRLILVQTRTAGAITDAVLLTFCTNPPEFGCNARSA